MVKDSMLFQEVNYLYDLYSKKFIDYTLKKREESRHRN